MEEFSLYLSKIKQIESHDRIKDLMGRRKSKELVHAIKLNFEEKKEQIDKIKNLVKQSEKTNKIETSNLIENYDLKKKNTEVIVSKEIDDQSENFKKRLEDKKMQRMNSQPTFKSMKVN